MRHLSDVAEKKRTLVVTPSAIPSLEGRRHVAVAVAQRAVELVEVLDAEEARHRLVHRAQAEDVGQAAQRGGERREGVDVVALQLVKSGEGGFA